MNDINAGFLSNLDVKEQDFLPNEKGIPIAGKYNINGNRNAIGEYLIAPDSGTFVLGSKNGTIQWIDTEECQ